MSKRSDLKAVKEFEKEHPGQKQRKGFAVMNVALQRANNKAHKFTSETARMARIKQLEKKPVYKIATCQVDGCNDTYTVRGGAKYCFTHKDEYIERNSNRKRYGKTT